ncbi:hypothetical protein [Lysobacter solisilvae (ex Woo and Kim 2020)]|uniref:Uncharacterized protein n=1 Tax=Agrilutibacter terrestris TaxID=2865112 RepID=A0A7H0FVX0_9GAMM|nr:hypothetical protein [Lysobacter terrestris]QNP40186.1 hypothetical protein H8B22_11910 [Lysobacter terrestris]
MDGYWFTSTLFEIEPGEDEEINPRMYGRQLAAWLKTQLEQRGYDIEPVIAEDWGRCLMCSREPFTLWVGCGSVVDYGTASHDDPPPAKENVIWHCFPMAEVPFWKRILKRPDTSTQVSRLDADLRAILNGEPTITLVAQP